MGGSTVKYFLKYNRANFSLFDWKKQNLSQTSQYFLYKITYICIFREEVCKEDMIFFMYLLGLIYSLVMGFNLQLELPFRILEN